MGSLNGVYLKLTRPVELRTGRGSGSAAGSSSSATAEPLPPAEPLQAEDGEEFWSADLHPLAYLDFIRPNGERGLRFPVTNPDRTVLGRESRPGKPVDVALPDDDWVSGQHAQVRRDGGRFFLEDLHSRNGTFVRVEGPAEVTSGDVLLVGRVLLRVVDTSSGRRGGPSERLGPGESTRDRACLAAVKADEDDDPGRRQANRPSQPSGVRDAM